MSVFFSGQAFSRRRIGQFIDLSLPGMFESRAIALVFSGALWLKSNFPVLMPLIFDKNRSCHMDYAGSQQP